MIKVERALFSNVISAVQRTANLPGGGVRGIPGGVVIKGLDGVASFGADIQEAQKEYEKGRIRTSLERVRQLDAQFQGISSRWESTANNVLSSARSGTDQIPMQKLNEVKNAQTKMAQLTRPAAKAFQDLVTALETAVANEGREQADEEAEADEQAAKDAANEKDSDARSAQTSEAKPSEDASDVSQPAKPTAAELPEDSPELPDSDLLGQFGTNYVFGEKLAIKKRADGKVRITPALEANKFYFFHGMEPPRVLRVREVQSKAIIVFDAYYAQEAAIDTKELKPLLRAGIWRLNAK